MRKIYLLLFLFFPYFAWTQCDDFVVFQVKGSVSMNENGGKLQLKKNVVIPSNCKIFISNNSSLVLLCGNDRALSITNPGFYTYENLKSACLKNKSSLSKEYFKYVAQKIIEKEEPQTVMVIKGAVYRTKKTYEYTSMIQPKDSAIISSDSLKFVWHKPINEKSIYFLLYENGVNKLINVNCKDSSLSLSTSIFKKNTIYFWIVSNSETPNDDEVRFHFIYDDWDWKENYLINMETIKEDFIKKGDLMKGKFIQEQEQKKEEYLKEQK